MKIRVAVLTAVALIAVAGASSSAPPIDRAPVDREEKGKPIACTGNACSVDAYGGELPTTWSRLSALGCEAPFTHEGGAKPGQTAWVGASCPERARASIPASEALASTFADGCLPKRTGRFYAQLFVAECSLTPSPSFALPAVAQNLGCSPVYMYTSGTLQAPHVYYGSYCPDTPAVRNASKEATHDTTGRGFAAGYCDGCLKVPAGQVFAMWKLAPSHHPNCPGGCALGGGAGRI